MYETSSNRQVSSKNLLIKIITEFDQVQDCGILPVLA